jgi:hypothetical protein
LPYDYSHGGLNNRTANWFISEPRVEPSKQSTIFALFTSPSKYCNMQNDLSITTDIVPNQWKLLFIDRHIANSVDDVLYRPLVSHNVVSGTPRQ